MTTKALQITLGSIGVYATGYYQVDGQWYYYDATIGQWYTYSAGYLYPLAITEMYPTKPVVHVAPGDQLKITISYIYSGPASIGVEEYFSIGSKPLLQYAPHVVKKHYRNLPVTTAPTEYTWTETLTIPNDIEDDWTYLECKVWHGTPNVPEAGIRLKDAITLEVVHAGSITTKQLEFSGSSDGNIPVASVPSGVSAKLHIWGRNDMGISQGMGIHWLVFDPDGSIVEEYTDWGGTIGPYPTDHEFISSGQFNLDKPGKYTAQVSLYMGTESDSVQVDSFIGDICTVQEPGEVPSDFNLIRDHTYELASTYYGQAEQSTVTFSVIAPSFMLTEDKIAEMVTSFEDKFAEEGAHMLTLKLYEKRGLVQTDYSADIVTTIPTAAATGSTVPTIFGISTTVFIAILIAVCLIIGLIIILVVRKDVNQFLFGTPPTDGEPGTVGLFNMIGYMVVIMMMTMMMEQMGPMLAPVGAPPRPKPVTEAAVRAARVAAKAVVKVAPVVGKAVVKAAPVAAKAVKEVTKRF